MRMHKLKLRISFRCLRDIKVFSFGEKFKTPDKPIGLSGVLREDFCVVKFLVKFPP